LLEILAELLFNTNCAHDANHAGDALSNILGIGYRETAVRLACQVYDVSAGIDVDLIRRSQVRMLRNRLAYLRCDPCIIG
jgi:hypothetical protein